MFTAQLIIQAGGIDSCQQRRSLVDGPVHEHEI